MKKILSLALMVSFLGLGFSQDKKPNHKVGLKAGLVMSKWSMENVPDGITLGFKPGFTVAATYEYSIIPNLGIEPGVAFSMLGGKMEAGDMSQTLSTNYLEIPIGIKYYPIEQYFSIDVVPTMGFLMSSKSKMGDTETDYKEDTETFNFGLGLGITGYYSGIELGFRYNIGLTDISKKEDDGSNPKNKFSGFMIYAGYSLPL